MPKMKRALARTKRDAKGVVTEAKVRAIRNEQIEHGRSSEELRADW